MSLSLEKPLIYLITKGEATDSNFANARLQILEIVRIAIEERVSLIQIREKQLWGKLLFELTASIAAITQDSETKLLVNDRADIALAANTDGVHLAANSLPVDVIRQNFPDNFIIGASTHSVDAAINAKKKGADFVVYGPLFATPGKADLKGLDGLSAVCEKLKPFPVIGLGGIDETNFESVMASGASGIAAIRFLNEAEKMRKIAAKLIE